MSSCGYCDALGDGVVCWACLSLLDDKEMIAGGGPPDAAVLSVAGSQSHSAIRGRKPPPPQPKKRDTNKVRNEVSQGGGVLNHGFEDDELRVYESSGLLKDRVVVPQKVDVVKSFVFEIRGCAVCGERKPVDQLKFTKVSEVSEQVLGIVRDAARSSRSAAFEDSSYYERGERGLIKSLVCEQPEPSFYFCSRCETSLSFGKLGFSLVDFGVVARLPELSCAEKLCIQRVRVCGRILTYRFSYHI